LSMYKENWDLLITNGIVITMDQDVGVIENGAVAVKGDTIAAVGDTQDFLKGSAAKIIDANGDIIMPGLVNTHTHAAMTFFRGLADDLPLMTWLNDYIFPAEAQLTKETVYWGTLLACAEMISSGTTCFCDMYLFEDAVAKAAHDAGMRAVVGEVLFDFPSPNYGPIEKGFLYTEDLISEWANDPLITIAVEPHSPYLCAPALLKEAHELTRRHGLPLIIHLSETQHEVDEMKTKYGRTPVQHLAEEGILSDRLLACHCVVLSEEDISLLLEFDVKVSHNPESNMKLASGIAPVTKLIEKGICVGLGTDGCASNNNLDMLWEMDTAAKLQKVDTLNPTVLNAAQTLCMATIDGARALGLSQVTGSLAPGKKADLIVIDTHQPHMIPMYNPLSHVVYAAKGSDVKTSVINGRIVMEDRIFQTFNMDDIRRNVNRIAQKLERKYSHGI
jgi:5-methylthioadenosine/S-adenosylhomocysteine deaminase